MVIETKLNIGAEKPFTLLHFTDTHLTFADERDDERKQILARQRTQYFPKAEKVMEEVKQLLKKENALIIHTGDFIDFVSVANLEYVKRFTDEYGGFYTAGNHEFSLYVGEAKEDEAYRNISLATVQKSFPNDIRMASMMVNGINFVGLDDGYYLFDERQYEFLKNEIKKGLPIVLLLHNPIFERTMYDDLIFHREKIGLEPVNTPCAYLTAVPEELMKNYEKHRFLQQRADDITLRTVELIRKEPLIKAIIAGHIHCNYDGKLKDGVPQIVTSTEDIRLIRVS